MKHKHCEVIKAWADGAQIQYKDHESGRWEDIDYPAWHDATQHRIKPKPLEWYEQIPSHGVLCWVDDYSNDDFEHLDRILHYSDKNEFPFRGAVDTWKFAKPLTNDEIKKFLREE